MKLTIKEYFKKNVEVNGEIKKLVREELAIDSTADLPTADYKEGLVLAMGSAAWDVSTGDFYGLDSSGVWTNQKTGAKTIQITLQPVDVEVESGSDAAFTVAANGYSLTYQWQASSDGTTYTDISSATSTTYSFTTAAADDGKYFRCVITDGDSHTATSNAAKLDVNEPEPEPEPDPDPEPDDNNPDDGDDHNNDDPTDDDQNSDDTEPEQGDDTEQNNESEPETP